MNVSVICAYRPTYGGHVVVVDRRGDEPLVGGALRSARSTLRSRPLATAWSESGTVSATRWLSGSSAWVSLFGHQTLAPSSWQATLIQGSPPGPRAQMNPPSHGGFSATFGRPL